MFDLVMKQRTASEQKALEQLLKHFDLDLTVESTSFRFGDDPLPKKCRTKLGNKLFVASTLEWMSFVGITHTIVRSAIRGLEESNGPKPAKRAYKLSDRFLTSKLTSGDIFSNRGLHIPTKHLDIFPSALMTYYASANLQQSGFVEDVIQQVSDDLRVQHATAIVGGETLKPIEPQSEYILKRFDQFCTWLVSHKEIIKHGMEVW